MKNFLNYIYNAGHQLDGAQYWQQILTFGYSVLKSKSRYFLDICISLQKSVFRRSNLLPTNMLCRGKSFSFQRGHKPGLPYGPLLSWLFPPLQGTLSWNTTAWNLPPKTWTTTIPRITVPPSTMVPGGTATATLPTWTGSTSRATTAPMLTASSGPHGRAGSIPSSSLRWRSDRSGMTISSGPSLHSTPTPIPHLTPVAQCCFVWVWGSRSWKGHPSHQCCYSILQRFPSTSPVGFWIPCHRYLSPIPNKVAFKITILPYRHKQEGAEEGFLGNRRAKCSPYLHPHTHWVHF